MRSQGKAVGSSWRKPFLSRLAFQPFGYCLSYQGTYYHKNVKLLAVAVSISIVNRQAKQ